LRASSTIEASPYLWRPLATDIGAALAVLDSAVSEMEDRYRALAKEGFVSISDRIEAGRIDLPFIVLVFDEFADLVLTGRNEKRNSRTGLRVWPGRAAPLAFISCWQRSTLTGQ
jgi:S-DNA-T family DNA segregation ATPase FtsK/SpoIIIE